MVMVVVLHWYQELPAPQLCSFSQNELSQNYDLCHWQHCRWTIYLGNASMNRTRKVNSSQRQIILPKDSSGEHSCIVISQWYAHPSRRGGHQIQWRIIACESSDYRHIVHDDGFVWLMFVHERFSVSEQTLNSQNHGVHYMSVITRLTCNNSILLTRNSPDWQTYRDDTADDTVLCISGIVLGMTGLHLWLACVHKGNIRRS